jgi:signal transduction histidine kinase
MDNFRLGEGYIGTVAETGKPMVCMDLNEDLRFLRRAVVQAGYRCIACIPLTAHGSTLGVICLASRKDRHFTPRVMDLLLAIGTWAGLSIENARLHRQAQRLAVLEERERIGMDLHDGIIQSIYAVGLSLDYAQVALDDNPDLARAKIDQAIHGLNNAIRDIRSYILDLRPRQFTSEDLVSGLESLVLEFNANSQAEARLSVPDDGLVGLPTANASALFHICQEALANVAKHAHAREARVNLWRSDDRVLLEISDNGRGFDLGQMSVTIGHGLSNMHIRARKVGGDVEITSDPDKGTTVLAWVPNRA